MPIETHWANNQQSILIEKFYDVWTWQEVSVTCHTTLYSTFLDLEHPIVIIQDMIGSHWTPTTSLLKEVEQLMKSPCPDNLRMVQVVSGNTAVDTLVVSAYKRYGRSDCVFQAHSTVNEAVQVASQFLKNLS